MAQEAGHGATIAIEQTTPGVFVVIGELNGDITWPALTRPKTDTTAHQHTIGRSVRGVMMTEDLTFSVNFDKTDTTHGFTNGLYAKMISGATFGVRLRGPSGTANSDEWIMSGGLINITQVAPVREGVRTSDITFAPSGPFIIDGQTVGT